MQAAVEPAAAGSSKLDPRHGNVLLCGFLAFAPPRTSKVYGWLGANGTRHNRRSLQSNVAYVRCLSCILASFTAA